MAEQDQLDDVLRDALQQAAGRGEPTGVADAIRSRLAAGDPGAPVMTASAQGWGIGSLGWMPWVGLVALAGLVGGGLGASGAMAGVLGVEPQQVAVVSHNSMLDATASVSWCPGGPTVDTLPAGTRVLTVERSEPAGYLGVRNPNDFSAVLWLTATDLVIDVGQDAASLPIGDPCPTVTVVEPEPVAPAPQAPGPQPPSTPSGPSVPPAPGDTTAPTLGAPSASKNPIYALEPVTISVSASDNVGVSSVSITWSGQYSGGGSMSYSGGSWRYTFTPPSNDTGTITFTVRAHDAAGNASSPKSVVVNHQFFG